MSSTKNSHHNKGGIKVSPQASDAVGVSRHTHQSSAWLHMDTWCCNSEPWPQYHDLVRVLPSIPPTCSFLELALYLCPPSMHHFMSLAPSSLIFFLVGAVLAQDQRSCYFPDGSLSLKDTPCTSDTNTTCCGQGFACLENGICQVTTLAQAYDPKLNPLINYYRGSCTDQRWSSPQCPQFCIGSQCKTPRPGHRGPIL